MLQEASITYDEEYRVNNLLLYSEDQQIAVDGVIDPDGEQNLVLTIESFRIGGVADLLDYEGLDGTLNGYLDLTGPAAAPRIEGRLDLGIVSRSRPAGDLTVQVGYDSLRLHLDALVTHKNGSTLAVDGYLPVDLSIAPADSATIGEGVQLEAGQVSGRSRVSFTAKADSFAIGWINPFLDDETIDDLDGRLTADIAVTGTLDNPELDGALRLSDGRFRLPEFGVTYRDLQAQAVLERNQLQLSQATLRSGSGEAVADGTVSFANLTLGEFDINARLKDFRAVASDEYHATVSGNLQLNGSTRAPVVTGNLEVVSADVYLENIAAGDIEVVKLTERDLRMLEEQFGYRVGEEDTTTFDFYEAMEMNLNVELERDTWLRQSQNPEMAIQLTGRLSVQKQPAADPQMFGTIEVLSQRSYINQFGRRFNITNGNITFNGPAANFVMDVEAEYQVRSRQNAGQPEATIILSLSGRLENLELELNSDPPGMENTDILSYIATGRPAGQTFQLGGGLLAGGADLAASQIANIVEGVAAQELGLDVMEIQQSGLRGAELIAGKYVSPKLFVGVSQPVTFTSTARDPNQSGANATEITLEYEIIDWLLLRFSGGRTSLQGNLLWEYAY